MRKIFFTNSVVEMFLGGDQLVSVVGHFCRLCRMFYADEYTAKVVHCGSREHRDKYEVLKNLASTDSIATVAHKNFHSGFF